VKSDCQCLSLVDHGLCSEDPSTSRPPQRSSAVTLVDGARTPRTGSGILNLSPILVGSSGIDSGTRSRQEGRSRIRVVRGRFHSLSRSRRSFELKLSTVSLTASLTGLLYSGGSCSIAVSFLLLICCARQLEIIVNVCLHCWSKSCLSCGHIHPNSSRVAQV
jgi:hypothetical protein